MSNDFGAGDLYLQRVTDAMSPTNPVDAPWEPFTPMEVAELFRPLPCPWWIAGGYAIEHAVGCPFRSHGDVDVLILHRDHATVREFLADWDVWAADPPGTLRRWDRAQTLSDAVRDVWVRPMSAAAWKLQLMLDDAEGGIGSHVGIPACPLPDARSHPVL